MREATQGLRYRVACDITKTVGDTSKVTIND